MRQAMTDDVLWLFKMHEVHRVADAGTVQHKEFYALFCGCLCVWCHDSLYFGSHYRVKKTWKKVFLVLRSTVEIPPVPILLNWTVPVPSFPALSDRMETVCEDADLGSACSFWSTQVELVSAVCIRLLACWTSTPASGLLHTFHMDCCVFGFIHLVFNTDHFPQSLLTESIPKMESHYTEVCKVMLFWGTFSVMGFPPNTFLPNTWLDLSCIHLKYSAMILLSFLTFSCL